VLRKTEKAMLAQRQLGSNESEWMTAVQHHNRVNNSVRTQRSAFPQLIVDGVLNATSVYVATVATQQHENVG